MMQPTGRDSMSTPGYRNGQTTSAECSAGANESLKDTGISSPAGLRRRPDCGDRLPPVHYHDRSQRTYALTPIEEAAKI
jgi:hypothetical protein